MLEWAVWAVVWDDLGLRVRLPAAGQAAPSGLGCLGLSCPQFLTEPAVPRRCRKPRRESPYCVLSVPPFAPLGLRAEPSQAEPLPPSRGMGEGEGRSPAEPGEGVPGRGGGHRRSAMIFLHVAHLMVMMLVAIL